MLLHSNDKSYLGEELIEYKRGEKRCKDLQFKLKVC